MEDDPDHPGHDTPESLIPYDLWTEQAMRRVAVQALGYAAREGLPGDHHFYLTFRTDDAGTVIPQHLRSQYPQEMTIVLQHQFWDLAVEEGDGTAFSGQVSIGLSFGGVPSRLVVPIHAITAFADPQVRFGLRFRYVAPPKQIPLEERRDSDSAPNVVKEVPQIVSLDAFRRRPVPRDS